MTPKIVNYKVFVKPLIASCTHSSQGMVGYCSVTVRIYPAPSDPSAAPWDPFLADEGRNLARPGTRGEGLDFF
jgi:hypothetical protein